MITYEEINP